MSTSARLDAGGAGGEEPIDNEGGLVPRPADVVAPFVSESADEVQREAEEATEGVATGVPAAASSKGVGAVNVGLAGASAATAGTFGLTNTEPGREALDTANEAGTDPAGAGEDVVGAAGDATRDVGLEELGEDLANDVEGATPAWLDFALNNQEVVAIGLVLLAFAFATQGTIGVGGSSS